MNVERATVGAAVVDVVDDVELEERGSPGASADRSCDCGGIESHERTIVAAVTDAQTGERALRLTRAAALDAAALVFANQLRGCEYHRTNWSPSRSTVRSCPRIFAHSFSMASSNVGLR